MTLEEFIGGQGHFMGLVRLMTLQEFIGGQGHFMGLVRLEKASNVARDLSSDYDYSQKYKSILVKTDCAIYAQQYSRK